MRWNLTALIVLCFASFSAAAAEKAHGLNIYFVDTEGGAATLIVTPAGESVLIDSGNPGSRDADRIYKATTHAGLKAIDNLLTTHWHTDHYGGVEHLAQLLPIHHFYDHGIPATLEDDPKNFPLLIQAYKKASRGKSQTLNPGDEVPLKQRDGSPEVHILCLCARREVMPDKPGAPVNAVADEHKAQADDPSDNARSLGFLLRYGDFRFLDLGDLTWNIEYKLVHPSDKIGRVDVFQSSHHGLDISNNAVLIKTVQPRVAVFNNGARKGCEPSVTANLRRVPGIQAIYQMHRNVRVGPQENTDPEFIANEDEECQGKGIHIAVASDSKSYQVSVDDKAKSRRYQTRSPAKAD